MLWLSPSSYSPLSLSTWEAWQQPKRKEVLEQAYEEAKQKVKGQFDHVVEYRTPQNLVSWMLPGAYSQWTAETRLSAGWQGRHGLFFLSLYYMPASRLPILSSGIEIPSSQTVWVHCHPPLSFSCISRRNWSWKATMNGSVWSRALYLTMILNPLLHDCFQAG